MTQPSVLDTDSKSDSKTVSSRRYEELEHHIEHAGHLLPAQGPIRVFIHHNTLHAFEHLKFDEGVLEGARLFGCQPYLAEERYREYLQTGRIREADLAAVLLEDLGDSSDDLLGFMGTRFHFRLAMLKYPVRLAPAAELRWFIAETDALERYRPDAPAKYRQRCIDETRHWVLRDLRNGAEPTQSKPRTERARVRAMLSGLIDQFGRHSLDEWSEATWESFTLRALWRICREGVHHVKLSPASHPPAVRHRDVLFDATGADTDVLVHQVLIPYCAAFLDQGLSRWPLPKRELGFFRCFSALYQQKGMADEPWMKLLREELARIEAVGLTPLESIEESLRLLGVHAGEQEKFVVSTMLALRGWAGMIRQVEFRADRVRNPVPLGSLTEFLAVRLLLDRLAVAWTAQEELAFVGPLDKVRKTARGVTPKHASIGLDQRAFLIFRLAQILGWLPHELHALSEPEWETLVTEIEDFSAIERRRLFHAAFERRYRIQSLDAIAAHPPRNFQESTAPRFQLITCLDEREESFRRHVEEIAPDAKTIGAAGFYNVAMYYQGVGDAQYVPLCPIIVVPKNWAKEEVVYFQETLHDRRAKARRAVGMVSHRVHVGSRGLTIGALLTAGFGTLASIPMVARVLFPRLAARIRRTANRFMQPPQETYLKLERSEPEPGPENGHIGFNLPEMADMLERLLRDMGLVSNFGRLVLVLGHGSESLNNPHLSAYNCGACGGSAGGPNARAIAQIANDPRVRTILAEHGIEIPHTTVFVGGYHNTCDDSVTFSDVDQLPHSHEREFREAVKIIEEACNRNAHERCRRFVSAPLDMSFSAARRHVQARSEDLAQVRPECGHASNALCIVGRRSRTRGLFLDRRAFLTSYDPTQDDADSTILHRVLKAAVPVCAGINLEYYFSYVDSVGWGCGTKLPQNLTSMLGVMDGAASDLRPGLPWQMVEIHEPVRLLFVVETTPEAMNAILDRDPNIAQVCRNGWVQLATLDPHSQKIHVLRAGHFEPYVPESQELPQIEDSLEWYRGWRGNLGYAALKLEEGGVHAS